MIISFGEAQVGRHITGDILSALRELPSSSVDAAYSEFEHAFIAPDCESIILELYRVLRPGAYFRLCMSSLRLGSPDETDKPSAPTLQAVVARYMHAGFSVSILDAPDSEGGYVRSVYGSAGHRFLRSFRWTNTLLLAREAIILEIVAAAESLIRIDGACIALKRRDLDAFTDVLQTDLAAFDGADPARASRARALVESAFGLDLPARAAAPLASYVAAAHGDFEHLQRCVHEIGHFIRRDGEPDLAIEIVEKLWPRFSGRPLDYFGATGFLFLIQAARAAGRDYEQIAHAVYEATDLYRNVPEISGGHLAVALTQKLGRPSAPVRSPPPGYLYMDSTLLQGRTGNQIVQVAFAMAAADMLGRELVVGPWFGHALFERLNRCAPPAAAPHAQLTDYDVLSLLQGGALDPSAKSVTGYFNFPFAHVDGAREVVLSRMTPRTRAAEWLSDPASLPPGYIAVHVRRGDFGYAQFKLTPGALISDTLRELVKTIALPIVVVSDSTPEQLDIDDDIKAAAIWPTPATPGPMAAILDWLILAEADVIVHANSTFSFSAALLNTKCRAVIRPDRDMTRMASYNPWKEVAFVV